MNPGLTKLRAEMRKCEEFIALCELIRHSEKLLDGRLDEKKFRLEAEMGELLQQMDLVAQQKARFEADLNTSERPVGLLEKEQLIGLIKTARIRLATLEQGLHTCVQEIDRINQSKASAELLLRDLYSSLEAAIQTDGFDPNTIEERLAALRHEKNVLVETLKANVSTRTTSASQQGAHFDPANSQRSDKTGKPIRKDGLPLRGTEFNERLSEDFAKSRKSIEIISPYIEVDTFHDVLSELAPLAARGLDIKLYIKPLDEQQGVIRADAQVMIIAAHKSLVNVIQRSGIEYCVVIIDNLVCWEGGINILGRRRPSDTMRRTAASSHARELRHFLFKNSNLT